MAIADLYNIPTDTASMQQWSFAHMAHHRDMIRVVQQTLNIHLDEYILDPVNLNDPIQFLDQHQTMHQQLDRLFGISTFDLTQVKWDDPGQRSGWIWQNAQLHLQEANATGVF